MQEIDYYSNAKKFRLEQLPSEIQDYFKDRDDIEEFSYVSIDPLYVDDKDNEMYLLPYIGFDCYCGIDFEEVGLEKVKDINVMCGAGAVLCKKLINHNAHFAVYTYREEPQIALIVSCV